MPSRVCVVLCLLMVGCSKKDAGTRGPLQPGHDSATAADAGVGGGHVAADGSVAARDGGRAADGGAQVDGGSVVHPSPDTPPPYVEFDTMVSAMRDDVMQLDNPAERKDVRYLVLSHLANAGASAKDVALHRSTMNLLVNSLSRGALLVSPAQLDKAPNVFRINLRDYRWTQAQWETIVASYPYEIQYKASSQVFPRDELAAQSLRDQTGTKIPFVFLEWFATQALRASIYYDLLNFPSTLAALGQQVDVDIAGDIAEERIARAGLEESIFSPENRLLERHDRVGNAGVFWLSYDFAQSAGKQDIFAHPLDFQHDGSEVIYALPNGLSAYMVVDAQGTRLDATPLTLGSDPRSPDRIASPGLSCMGNCHYAHGFEKITDEVRAAALSSGAAGIDPNTIRAIYPTQDKLDALLDADRKLYEQAAATVGVDLTLDRAPYQTVERYHGDVDLPLAAALLGLRTQELKQALQGATASVPPEIRSLADGKTLSRRSFEELFASAVCTLGIGEPLCAAKACGCATLTP